MKTDSRLSAYHSGNVECIAVLLADPCIPVICKGAITFVIMVSSLPSYQGFMHIYIYSHIFAIMHEKHLQQAFTIGKGSHVYFEFICELNHTCMSCYLTQSLSWCKVLCWPIVVWILQWLTYVHNSQDSIPSLAV